MKRLFQLLLICLITCNIVVSQINKGNFTFSVNGNYIKSGNQSIGYSYSDASNFKQLQLDFQVGYLINSHVELGLGVEYIWSNEIKFNSLFIGIISKQDYIKTKTSGFIPKVYSMYHYNILSKLSVDLQLSVGYGKIKSTNDGFLVLMQNYDSLTIINPGTNTQFGLTSYTGGYDNKLLVSQIVPGLSYYIKDFLGIQLKLGGIENIIYNWDTKQTIWNINFNPIYWKLGLILKI